MVNTCWTVHGHLTPKSQGSLEVSQIESHLWQVESLSRSTQDCLRETKTKRSRDKPIAMLKLFSLLNDFGRLLSFDNASRLIYDLNTRSRVLRIHQ